MPISLPDLPVRDFAGINRALEALARHVSPSSAVGTVGNLQLQDDSVDARVLRDDAAIDANRAVTRNHIRNGAVNTQKLDAAVPLAKRYAQVVGDGALTSIAIDHLLGTRDVQVELYGNADPWATVPIGAVLTAVKRTTIDTVTLEFAAAPAAAAYRVVVVA